MPLGDVLPCTPSHASFRGGPRVELGNSGSVLWGSGCLISQAPPGTGAEDGAFYSSEVPQNLKDTLSVQQVVQQKPTVAGSQRGLIPPKGGLIPPKTLGISGWLWEGEGREELQVELSTWRPLPGSRGSGSGRPQVPHSHGWKQAGGPPQVLCVATAVPLS